MENTHDECPGSDDDETQLLFQHHQQSSNDGSIQSSKLALNIDEALEKLKLGPFHYIFLVICGLCNSAYAISYTSISFIIITACDLDINPISKGWLSLCLLIGIAVSSPVLGKLSDVYGRWKVMVFSMTIYLIFMIVAAFSYNYAMLLVIFFIIGIAVGGLFTVSGSYALEFFPRHYRGIAVGSRIAITIISVVYVCLIALLILPHHFSSNLGALRLTSWRIFLLLCTLPVAMIYIPLFFMPESFRFVLAKEKLQDILSTLNKIKRINLCCRSYNDSSLQEIRSLLLDNLDKVELEDTSKQYSPHTSQSSEKFCRRPWIIRSLILCIAWLGATIGVEGCTIWLPTVVNYYNSGNRCRSNIHHNLSWSSVHTLQSSNLSFCAGNQDITPTITNILFGSILAIPFAFFCLFIINRIGRKWLFCLLIFTISISLFLIWVIDNKIATLIISVIFTMFANSIWIPLTTWSVELFPTSIRSTINGLLLVVVCCISAITLMFVGIIFTYSCTGTLMLFLSVNVLAGLVTLYLPDTTNEDIK